jgi:hypothetical protein
MNVPHRWIVAVAGALLVVGCSTPDAAAPAPGTTLGTTSSTTIPASTTSAKKSGFCLDLTTFQVALVMYKSGAGKAISGEPLDFETLKRGAAHVARIGEAMQPSAPPEIADQFRAVLTAVATSASSLTKGSKVRDVVDPLYGKQNQAAFDAVENFDERGCGS